MKVFFFFFAIVLIGCKKSNPVNYDLLSEEHEKIEEEIINRYIFKEEGFVEYKDNIENKLQGTEAELLRMYELNDSLTIELYKCQQGPDI